METTAAEFAWAEALVRAAGTALVVIAVSLAVDRLGPAIGGALVGLPVTMGPGFFFMLEEHGAPFVAASAAYALLSLTASQAFLLAYVASAHRRSPGLSLLAASLAWLAAALVLSRLPPAPALAAPLFVLAVFLARRLARRYQRPAEGRRAVGGLGLLLARALLAGVLVAAVTAVAGLFGPGWSGLMLAYPIGFTVISVTVHERLGPDAAIATLTAAMLGVSSLAAFAGTLAILLPVMRAGPAFAVGIALALVATGLVATIESRRNRV